MVCGRILLMIYNIVKISDSDTNGEGKMLNRIRYAGKNYLIRKIITSPLLLRNEDIIKTILP